MLERFRGVQHVVAHVTLAESVLQRCERVSIDDTNVDSTTLAVKLRLMLVLQLLPPHPRTLRHLHIQLVRIRESDRTRHIRPRASIKQSARSSITHLNMRPSPWEEPLLCVLVSNWSISATLPCLCSNCAHLLAALTPMIPPPITAPSHRDNTARIVTRNPLRHCINRTSLSSPSTSYALRIANTFSSINQLTAIHQ